MSAVAGFVTSVVHGAGAPSAAHETSAALTIVSASVSEAIQRGDG
jgi:hypothetical protein